MHPKDLTPVGSVPPVSVSDCPAEGEEGDAAKVLRGVSDWIALCQRCAEQAGQMGTDYRPGAPHQAEAVIIPFKTRQGK